MTLQRENMHSPNTQNITVRAHDKPRFQPGASIHLEMGEGAICERRKQTDRWLRVHISDLWRGLQDGAAHCLSPFLVKKLTKSYLSMVKFLN